MFVEAIEKTSQYTRPIHSITRTYGSHKIIPGAGTLFFVNEEGFAITCKHVVEVLVNAAGINNTYATFRAEKNALPADSETESKLQELHAKYKYTNSSLIQVKNMFVDCVDQMKDFTVHVHGTYDLAILKFNGFNKLNYQGHAVFLKDTSLIKQGEFLCRLGFPFPEFSNHRFNELQDDIEWTQDGIIASPRFPIEGMVTRFLVDGKLYGIELSTPGLRGQSGGPLFNKDGIVYGMQFSTKHLHLGFDMINKEIISDNKPMAVTDYSFLHLGQCIHADIIKEFLREKEVKFYEA